MCEFLNIYLVGSFRKKKEKNSWFSWTTPRQNDCRIHIKFQIAMNEDQSGAI